MGLKEKFFCEITSLNPEVTGSCHIVTIRFPDERKTTFLVDCGLFQEHDYNYMNKEAFPFNAENISFVLITHGHADHIGKIPKLYNEGYNGKIYSTKATGKIMRPAFMNSLRIIKEEAKKKKNKPLYEEEDVEMAISRIVSCDFGETEYVNPNVKVTYFKNGHLIGAGMILVQISYSGEEDINLFFTGDYKPDNAFFEVGDLPEWVCNLPITIVTESTYGYMDKSDVKYHIEDDIVRVLKASKTILISVFALGRAQEILFMLKNLQDRKEIKPNIPIRLDGKLAQEYTAMYLHSELGIDPGKQDFLPQGFENVNKENRQEVLQEHRQQIILTTSGMMSFGPAQTYLPVYIKRKDAVVYIPGYMAPDTLGYKIQHPKEGCVNINGKEYEVKAQVMSTTEMSAHAKADEIIDLLNKFHNLNLVLVNHGDKLVKMQFAYRLQEEVDTKRVEILGEHTFRISHFGYIKHMGSKINVRKTVTKDKVEKKKSRNKRFILKKFFKKRAYR